MEQVLLDDITSILKSRLGIMHNKRDVYLNSIVLAIEDELNVEHGIKVGNSARVFQFVVDYAAYRYHTSNDTNVVFTQHTYSMPPNLRRRLNNIVIAGGVDIVG